MTYRYLVTVDIDTRVNGNMSKTMHDAYRDAIECYLVQVGSVTCDSHKVQVLAEPVQPGANSFDFSEFANFYKYTVDQSKPLDTPFGTSIELKFFMLGVLVGTVIAALVLPR